MASAAISVRNTMPPGVFVRNSMDPIDGLDSALWIVLMSSWVLPEYSTPWMGMMATEFSGRDDFNSARVQLIVK